MIEEEVGCDGFLDGSGCVEKFRNPTPAKGDLLFNDCLVFNDLKLFMGVETKHSGKYGRWPI